MPPVRTGEESSPPARSSAAAAAGPSTSAFTLARLDFTSPGAESPPSGGGGGGGGGQSSGSGSRDNGGLKQQKACIHCRKSKVKCINDGGPPCRRCQDARLECKFRLRADDENWRERTDDRLSQIASKLDAFISAAQPAHPQASTSTSGPAASTSLPYHHHHSHPSYPAMAPPPLPSPGMRARASSNSTSSPSNAHPSHPMMISRASPHSDHSWPMDHASPSNPRPPPPGGGGGGAGSLSSDSSSHHHRRSSSLRGDHLLAAPGSSGGGMPIGGPPHSPGGSLTPNTARYTGPPPFTSTVPALPPLALDPSQGVVPSSLQAISHDSAPFYLTNPLPMRWTSGVSSKESYGAPVPYIGRDDPRLTCVSRGLCPLERVRQLFMFFADRMQPHSFGFPTFPPSEQMTPLIISSIAMVASLHEATSRPYHGVLKGDVLSQLPTETDLTEDHTLDPELGIGVEEITAACIASAWLGGDEAWRLARTARWWALAYLRHYELNMTPGPFGGRSVTLGEALTILPPFRNIDLSVKLRIWLESYIVDAQQCFMLDRCPLSPQQTPHQYCETLRSVYYQNAQHGNFSNGNGPGSPGGANGNGGTPKMSSHDRQLIAHANLLDILLDAQRSERMTDYSALNRHHRNGSGPVDSGVQEEIVRVRLGQILGQMEAVDRWRELCRRDEDLSAATPSSMDLTFIYVLTRAYIGSLALSLPIVTPSTTAQTPGGTTTTTLDHDGSTSLSSSQVSLVSWAKEAALFSLELAQEKKGRGFGDRIVAMPTFYHYLLTQTVGFLLQLIQRKHRFLLAREARTILSKIEPLVQLYVFELNAHACMAPAYNFGGPTTASGEGQAPVPPRIPEGSGRHPASGMAEMMARGIAHVKAQSKG